MLAASRPPRTAVATATVRKGRGRRAGSSIGDVGTVPPVPRRWQARAPGGVAARAPRGLAAAADEQRAAGEAVVVGEAQRVVERPSAGVVGVHPERDQVRALAEQPAGQARRSRRGRGRGPRARGATAIDDR